MPWAVLRTANSSRVPESGGTEIEVVKMRTDKNINIWTRGR
jgi:hypothetical protein